MPGGELIAVGEFTAIGGAGSQRVARWNGASWSALGSGVGGGLFPAGRALAALPNGDLAVTGTFTTAGGGGAHGAATFDCTSWSSLGTTFQNMHVYAVAALSNGDLFAGGSTGTQYTRRVGQWNGSQWVPMGDSFDDEILAMAEAANGTVVAGGRFLTAPGVAAYYVAQWDGASWAPMGLGTNGPVEAVVALPNGDIVVGGSFSQAGGQTASRIARWDGTNWHALGSGCNGAVHALAVLPNGDLVVGGSFTWAGGSNIPRIARWDGAGWSPISGTFNNAVRALAVTGTGDLVAGGDFTFAGGGSANRVARWDGVAWSQVGAGFNGPVLSLLASSQGRLVAGGGFWQSGGQQAFYIAEWDGSSWTAVGGGLNDHVLALAEMPNGDVAAGGYFGQSGFSRIARFDGASWSTFGHSLDGLVTSLVMHSSGELLAGGSFDGEPVPQLPGRVVSRIFARFASPCAAGVTPVATACIGPAGPMTVSASRAPWLGSTFESAATGFSPNGIAFSVFGLASASLPLSLVDPAGLPGCDLLVTPTLVTASLPTNGAASAQLALPNTPSLGGVLLHHQFVQAEFWTNGLLTLSSSNALELTLGWL
ncbi:MAG: hypothetical protein KAI24_11120, partial [Planctomycetes bacterium]|nr:hypothetical protein [Planctomycetota bacterium]